MIIIDVLNMKEKLDILGNVLISFLVECQIDTSSVMTDHPG